MTSYYLLDVRGLIIRAASTGEKTVEDGEDRIVSWQEGLYRFYTREILPLIKEGIQPRQIIACWDAGNTFRLNLFPSYKEKRRSRERSETYRKENNELFDKAKRLMAYMGIKNVWVPGEEADDLIALFCENLEADHITIRTVDEDLLQLLSEKVSIYHGHKHYLYQVHADSSTDKGTPISLLALYKSIVGDTSDEYPGVPGMGPAKFNTLLESYGIDGMRQLEEAVSIGKFNPIEEAYKATEDKLLHALLERWTEWRLCYKLATLHPEVCYGTYAGKRKNPEWYVRVPNLGKVDEILSEMDIGGSIHEIEHVFAQQELIDATNSAALQKAVGEILSSPVVSYDFESSDKNQFECYQLAKTKGSGPFVDVLSQELAGISINYGQNMEKTIYVPFDHSDTANYPMEWAQWLLNTISTREGPTVVQNAAFEVTVAANNVGVWVKPPFDTRIMASYVDENEPSDLKSMSLRVLGYKQTTYMEVTGGRGMYELTAKEVLSYGCDDSLVTSHLFDLYRIIMQLEGSWEFYRKNEVSPIIDDAFIFSAGTDLDVTLLGQFRKDNLNEIENKEAELRDLLQANVDNSDTESAKERAKVLFNEWWKIDSLSILGKENEKERLDDLKAKLWTRAWFSCFYTPVKKEESYNDIIPTPALISKLADKFVPGAPKLTKATNAAVEEWEAATMDFIGTTSTDGSKKLEELTGLVFAARKVLAPAKRSGAAYEALMEFCGGCVEMVGKKKTTITGDELNFGSTIQMQGLLYGKMGLPIRVRSKVDRGSTRDKYGLEGSPATGLKAIAAAIVFDLSENDWRYAALMAYKGIAEAQQNESLYYSKYPHWRSPIDGKLHPQIKNCGTVTRRPSGSSPNVLQVSGKDGSRIRKLFPAGNYGDGDRLIVSIDWQGQELLIIACESKDPVMLDAFMSSPRKDIHSVTGTALVPMVFERLGGPRLHTISYSDFVTGLHDEKSELHPYLNKVRKTYAKPCNFGIAYGGGPNTLARNMLIDIELARGLLDSTFSLYNRIKPWQEETVEFAKTHGYSLTAYGNRRHAEKELWGGDSGMIHRVGRQLVNATVQSTAADILKVTKQVMRERDIVQRYQARAVKPIYDELTASIPKHLVGAYVMEMTEIMRITPPGYPVSLDIDVEIGRTWGDQIEVKPTSADDIAEQIAEL